MMWKQLSSPSFYSHCHHLVYFLNTLCPSYDNRLLRLSTPPVSYHCYPSREVPEEISYNTAVLMFLPWVKTANDCSESIISSPQSFGWLLTPLVKSLNLKYSNCFSIALQYTFSFLIVCQNQNHLPSPDCSPTFSTKFYKLPKPDYYNLLQLEIPIGFMASNTDLSISLGLIALCFTLIVSFLLIHVFVFPPCNI